MWPVMAITFTRFGEARSGIVLWDFFKFCFPMNMRSRLQRSLKIWSVVGFVYPLAQKLHLTWYKSEYRLSAF